jgi:hypothetical protein
MTPVCSQGFLYGQFDGGSLKCIDMQTGFTNWASASTTFNRGGTILVDNTLVSLTENGWLVLAEAKTNAYVELGRFLAIPNAAYNSSYNKCWNSPAVCDGRIYVRSTAYAACFDLSIPDLKLDPPSLVAPGQMEVTVRTVTGSPVSAERMGNIGLWTSPDLGVPLLQWSKLGNTPVLSNGVVLFQGIDMGVTERRYFVIHEP